MFTNHTPERPVEAVHTSPVADYVLGVLPNDLAAIRLATPSIEDITTKYGEATEAEAAVLDILVEQYGELAVKHASILDDVEDAIAINEDPEVALVTQLDLAFMLSAYLPLGKAAFDVAPEKLSALLSSQATRFGIPERMDYELIIDVNSQEYFRTGDIRTFLNGEDALGERDFYQGHALSERHIKAVADSLKSIIDNPVGDHVDGALLEASQQMREFREFMARYINMSMPVFGKMRPYLASYPDGTRNASGAFMPSVQLAEMTFQAPTKAQLDYIEESMPYFPRWARPLINDWKVASLYGANITTMFKSGIIQASPSAREAYQTTLDEFLKSKKAHTSATIRQIPEAFAGRPDLKNPSVIAGFGEPSIFEDGVRGTAGFDVVNLLGGVTHRVVKLRDDFRAFNSVEAEETVNAQAQQQ